MRPGEPGAKLLNRGGWGNGAVWRIEFEGKPAVLKTYAGKPAPIRLIGRWLIAREKRAYRMLAGVAGVPGLLELDDPLGLAIEYVRAEWISERLPAPDGSAIIESLRAVIDRLHARGVYHLDLRNRGNVLIDAESRAHVVDFASALIVRSRIGRLLAPLLKRRDRRALAKWTARAGLPPDG